MIPLATTSVDVLRVAEEDLYAEPYSGDDTERRTTVATAVRAVIMRQSNRSTGVEQLAGGEQSVTDLDLVCDPVDLDYRDYVKDRLTGRVYRVVWIVEYPGDHVEAGLRRVQGEV